MIQAKVIELNGEILAAQQRAFEANSEHLALLSKVAELEKQISDLETWNTEKARYELRKVSSFSSFAYGLKENQRSLNPDHYLCATCYSRGKKSILQGTPEFEMRRRMFVCTGCSSRIPVETYPGQEPLAAS